MIVFNKVSKYIRENSLFIQKTYLQIYLVNLVLNFCIFYIANCPTVIRKGIGLLLMVSGLFLALINVWRYISSKRLDICGLLLIGLVGVMMLSGLVNYRYGITQTVKICVWSFILFFLVSPFFFNVKKEDYTKVFAEIVFPAMILWGIMEIVAVIQFLFQITYFVKLPEYPTAKAQGVYYNRVFGIFVDASMASTLSWNFLLCGVLIKCAVLNRIQILVTVTIVLNWIYIVLSGGRSAIVISVVGLFVCMWAYIVKKQQRKRHMAALLMAVFFSSLLVTGGKSITKTIMVQSANVVNHIRASESRDTGSENTGSGSTGSGNTGNGNIKDISLERTDLKGKPDLSNFRFQIWEDSLKTYFAHPIFGISMDGFIPYVKEHYQGHLIANGLDVGNGYLSVLVYAGPVAFALMVLFIIVEIKKLVPYFWAHFIQNTDRMEYLGFFAIITSIAVVAMINMDIFYINSADAMLFWLTLGLLNALYQNDKEAMTER